MKYITLSDILHDIEIFKVLPFRTKNLVDNISVSLICLQMKNNSLASRIECFRFFYYTDESLNLGKKLISVSHQLMQIGVLTRFVLYIARSKIRRIRNRLISGLKILIKK